MIIAASSTSNGQYGVAANQTHINVVSTQPRHQNSIANSHSNSSSSSLSPMRPSSSCSPISSSTSNNSDSSPKTTMVYSSAYQATRSSRKSPNHGLRYHPYGASVAAPGHIDSSAVLYSNSTPSQFYSATTTPVNASYYDQYAQPSFYAQPHGTGNDYSTAAAVAASGIQYNPTSLYADQSYYYAAQNAAAASFLMQQTQHQLDPSALTVSSLTGDGQSWKTENYPSESGIYSENNQSSTKQTSSSSASASSSSSESCSDSFSSASSSPVNSPPAKIKSKKLIGRSDAPSAKKLKLAHNHFKPNDKNLVKSGKSNKADNQQLKSKIVDPLPDSLGNVESIQIVGPDGVIEPKKRVSANKKERRRTQSINNAFTDLRNRIPQIPTDTKLSKIKTLKLAINYIEHLMKLLQENDPTSFEPFKPDLGKLRRECRSKEIKQEVERKAKGRTGWPSEVWSTELKRKLNDNTNNSHTNSTQPNTKVIASPSSINSSSSSSSLLAIHNGFSANSRSNNFLASTFGSALLEEPNGHMQFSHNPAVAHHKASVTSTSSFLTSLNSGCYSLPFTTGSSFASNIISDNNVT